MPQPIVEHNSSNAKFSEPDRSKNRSSSLAELIKQQGVSPVENLDELAVLWPGNDDPDDLLAYILHERKRIAGLDIISYVS